MRVEAARSGVKLATRGREGRQTGVKLAAQKRESRQPGINLTAQGRKGRQSGFKLARRFLILILLFNAVRGKRELST